MVYTALPGGGYASDRMPLPLQTSLGAPKVPQHIKKGPLLLADELLAHGVDYSKKQVAPLGFETRLPLSWFDDTDYESRQPHEWIASFRKASRRADGLALVLDPETGTGSWRYMKVHKYAHDKRQYVITAMDASNSMDAKPYPEDRVNLYFTDERMSTFAARVASAHRRRAEVEEDMLRRYYIEQMPTHELRSLSAVSINRILELAYSTERLRHGQLDPTGLVEEAKYEYARTTNSLLFAAELRQPTFTAQTRLTAEAAALIADQRRAPAPELGVTPLWLPASYEYASCAGSFRSIAAAALPEAVVAMLQVRYECLQLQKLSLYNLELSASIRLEDFEQMQMQHIMRFVQFLRDSWQPTVKKGVLSAIVDATPAWRQPAPQPSVYESPSADELGLSAAAAALADEPPDPDHGLRTRRMTRTINLMAADTLRIVTNTSLEAYADFICEHAARRGYAEDPDVLQRPALFVLDLVAHVDELFYSTSPEFFSSVPTRLVDEAVNAIAGLRPLDPFDLTFGKPVEDVGDLPTVSAEEPQVGAAKERMKGALEASVEPLTEYLEDFGKHLPHIALDVQAYVKAFANADAEEDKRPSLAEMKAKVDDHVASRARLERELPHLVAIGCYLVSVAQVRQLMIDKHTQVIDLVLQLIDARARERVRKLNESFVAMHSTLQETPATIERLTELTEYMTECSASVEAAQEQIDEMMAHYDVLESFKHDVQREDMTARWACFHWPMRMQLKMDEAAKLMQEDRATFHAEMVNEQKGFERQLEELKYKVADFGQHAEMSRVEQIHQMASEVEASIAEYRAKANTFAAREELFAVEERTEYDGIDKLARDFEPYASLWSNAHSWSKWHSKWLDGPLVELDPDDVDKSFSEAQRAMVKAVKAFREQPGCLAIASQIKEEMAAFAPFVPLVKALRDKGMRERHWSALSAQLGFDLHPNPSFTLRDATNGLQLHAPKTLETIERTCDQARKEYAIEKSLNEMQDAWASLNFEILPYRATGTGVIKLSDEVNTVLDDHIVLTQQFSFSPYKEPFEERIADWERQLRLVQDVTTEWLACQRNWMYLQPIFDSEDINRQLPAEGKRFSGVDRNWRKTIERVSAAPNIITFCDDAELLKQFTKANEELERVQKNLADYLETKRAAFARFYFLSNDELISILSQTKDPAAVQPHLRKCFEAVNSITMEGAENTMSSMTSAEKETVQFVETLQPKGSVEFWMGDIEAMMQRSVRKRIELALADYRTPGQPRGDFCLKWEGMVVIAATGHYWTVEVEEALTESTAGVRAYYDKQIEQLKELTKLVRTKLSKLQSLTMAALIVMEVHARDVVERLVEAGIERATDFEWVSQLRYYWEDVPSDFGATNLFARMVQCTFPYGYEYLGNSSRLVITPLTDKCYMTLMGALHMHLGGAPAGPAGTGKTESVKDLAKALAKQCVVFNCSDGLDYKSMGRFFKGIATAGAWACFDEFNRIDIEVLSVVAQQILTITNAIIDARKEFEFEGAIVKLNPTCSVFITMNPGYAGRTELPDNLKVLFRPVAMMVPDYALIGEIRLFSFGFDESRLLAQKLVGTFRLSSEQLSSQDHYDFGMRAVNTVIQAAGILKRTQSQMEEDLIMLRAIRDSNMPKFLRDDIILFRSIISDLFPGVQEPKAEYPSLEAAVREQAAAFGLQCVPEFMLKCIQLYEMTVVRHGMMLVGPTGGGKTRVLRTLQGAISTLKGEEGFEMTRVYLCNPKSITQNQLYGAFDLQTGEWTDGIAATLIRHMSQPDTEETGVTEHDIKWMMFDGPVDAVWIENMNTVLDDNKKLCLTSGEIIPLAPSNRMMFEVEDLAVASPATVSRCGMIFVEPGYLLPESRINPGAGLKPHETPLIKSWLERLPEPLHKAREPLAKLCDHLLHDGLELIRLQLRQTVQAVGPNQVGGVLRMLDALLLPLLPQENQSAEQAEAGAKRLATALEPSVLCAVFVYALTWSLGAVLDGESRAPFDAWLRGAGTGPFRMQPALPSGGLVFDFYLDLEPSPPRWTKWSQTAPPYEIPDKIDYQRDFAAIIVPTDASICYAALLETLLTNHTHTMCVGPTGTAKSVTVQQKLSRGMPERFEPILMAFSAQTGANQTQDILDGKFEKRRQGTDKDSGLAYTMWGPVLGKRFNIFIDDFNMPKREVYGAQPPLELLRTAIDICPDRHTGSAGGGWYDLKTLRWRSIVDVTLIGAMGPPGGGRNPVSNRMLRHMHFLSFVDMSDAVISTIFGTILDGLCGATFPALAELANPLVGATLGIYHTVCEQLLPTPQKSHYTFNLRDIAKVVQGVCMADKRRIAEKPDLVRLWVHECMRVFSDRLINDEDRDWFDSVLRAKCTEFFKLPFEQLVADGARLVYADFVTPGQEPPIYELVTDYPRFKRSMADTLAEYNELHMPMHLVLFTDAVEHICKICRVLRQPGGNALLLGVGGSGRQSLTKLAVHIAEYELFQVEITKSYGVREWRDSLKQVLTLAGHEAKHVAFLFTDTQIVNEIFLENINNILSSGEVPNLFDDADLGPIFEKVTPQLQQRKIPISKTNLYAAFVEQIRARIHIVLAMSPLSEAYRTRIRQFPSLVNCCTIDWFSPWPETALSSVARTNLAELEGSVKPEEYPGLIRMCVLMHQSVERSSTRYMEEMQRYNQVTPTSYLSLLSVLKSLHGSRYSHLTEQRNRLVIGLEKLASTKAQVAGLQAQLEENQPVLERTKVEVEEQQVQIAADKEQAALIRVDAEAAAEAAAAKAAECEGIKASAEEGLAKALPALEEAVKSLSKLKKDQIVEIKALKKPPSGVKLVLKAVCIMFEIKPGKTTDPDSGQKVDDWWGASQKLLNDLGPDKLKTRLVEFDKDSIKESTIKIIDPVCDDEAFQPEAIAKVSVACEAMCMWTHAMRSYYYVSKEVEPKRQQLAAATEQLNAAAASRDAASAKLQAVVERVEKLEAALTAAIEKKAQLEEETERCERQLGNAEKLLSGLGGEASNWETQSAEYQRQMDGITGDVLICAALISYLGPFVATYRADLIATWKTSLDENKVPFSKGVSVPAILSTPVEIRQWTIDGLPADSFSVENGCIISRTPRWPLLIDPQGQANKFLKTSQAKAQLKAIKASDSSKKIQQNLELGIRLGTPVMLENVLEHLDPFLEPVLLNQTYKDASGTLVLKLGDSVIPFHPDFRFSLTTVIPNPHYAPEVQVKVTLINFTITPDGLEEQLLGMVVATERPDLAEKKNRLVVEGAENRRKLSELQSDILYMLSNSEGNILDDTKLIETLGVSKETSEQIQTALAEAEIAEKEIDETREKYVPVAFRGATLFFAISDLSLIDPMYQYSLSWFTQLFVTGIGRAEASDDLHQRLTNVNDYVTYSLYVNVCRSLFEVHKLMFSFLVCVKVLMGEKMVDMAEWRFLLAGGMATGEGHDVPRPAVAWLDDKAWIELINLSALPKFAALDADVSANPEPWRAIIDSLTPQDEALPGRWDEALDLLQKMLVLRALRPDKVVPAVQAFVRYHLGQRFIEPPPFDLSLAYPDSSPTLPLIFVLSSGADPVKVLREYAKEVRMADKLESISLGQGQGPKAEKMIKDGKEQGKWVLLMNCHLFQSWMTTLEKEVEDVEIDKTNPDYRLWLTSMPSKFFPVSVLQNGVKMTFEPPKGLRLNLRTALTTAQEDSFGATKTPDVWRKVQFAIMLFHASILERRKFGPLGWNIPYEFTDGDRDVCLMQARMLIDEYEEPPWKVLNILTAVVNYGGRVTDTWDIRLIGNMLKAYLNENITRDGYQFTASGNYRSISAEDRQGYLDYVSELPVNAAPEAFGLHDNADITCAQNETYELFATILKLQPRQTSGGGKSRDEQIGDVASDIQTRVVPEFDFEGAVVKYPTKYEESMNTVLQQEIVRYNRLLHVIHFSLRSIKKAIKGEVVMSEELERMGTSLFNNQVPQMWADKAYPSLKPLAAWVNDLKDRTSFIQAWFDHGKPVSYWISGFFFPQAFLTGTLQNYARVSQEPIDTISWGYAVVDQPHTELESPPEVGVFVYGLFIEGASWDPIVKLMAEARPKELYSSMPVFNLKPTPNRVKPTTGIYTAPTYKTVSRFGVLSTTGHSTNYVMPIEIPTDKSESHWINRGVALITQLRY